MGGGLLGILQLALFSSAINLDVFIVSFCFGSTLSRAKLIPILALILSILQSMVPIAGYGIGSLVGPLIGSFAHYVGASILLLIGLVMFLEGSKANLSFDHRNLFLAYLGIGIDDLLAGVSIGTLGANWLGFLLIYFIIAFFMNFAALYLGKWVRRYVRFPAEAVTGVILMGIGTLSLFGLM